MNQNRINQIIRGTIKKVVNGKTKTSIREVKYFHPSGQKLPNSSIVQKGGFLKECKDNINSYKLDEGVHSVQYGLSKYRGGIITFSTDVNALELSSNKILNKIKQVIETFKQRLQRGSLIHKTITSFNNSNSENEYIGAYSVGNFFQGKYVGDNGAMYNEKSISVEINGLSSKSLMKVGELLAKQFRQETVLVKDLNNNKIYLVDPIESNQNFDDEMKNINTEV